MHRIGKRMMIEASAIAIPAMPAVESVVRGGGSSSSASGVVGSSEVGCEPLGDDELLSGNEEPVATGVTGWFPLTVGCGWTGDGEVGGVVLGTCAAAGKTQNHIDDADQQQVFIGRIQACSKSHVERDDELTLGLNRLASRLYHPVIDCRRSRKESADDRRASNHITAQVSSC